MKAKTLIVNQGHTEVKTFDFAVPTSGDLTECAIFLSKEGIAYDESEKVLPFTFFSMPEPHLEKDLRTTVRSIVESRRTTCAAWHGHTYVPALLPGYWNYYHFLIDCVPRILFSLQSNSTARVLVTQFQTVRLQQRLQNLLAQSGSLFGFADRLDVANGEMFHLERAIIPRPGLRFIGSTISLFRALGDALGQSNTKRRIYVSRRLAGARQVVNEPEVFTILQELGFQSVCLEQISLTEQVKLFRESEAIVGPHGAGLANIVFSGPGTTLIELLQEGGSYKIPIFSELTALVGGTHGVLLCKMEGDVRRPVANRDMSVDCGRLKEALKMLLG